MEYIYVQNSFTRNREFQVKTCIALDKGKKIVTKEAIYPEGIGNIRRIHHNSELLKEIYKDKFTDEVLVDNRIITDFWDNTTTLGDKLNKAILAYDKDRIKELLGLWRSLIIGNKENVGRFVETQEFKRIFGRGIELEGDISTYISNVDCSSENILFLGQSNNIKIIDYEWTFQFMIPVDFILYYGISLFSYRNGYTPIKKELLEIANINNDNILFYEEMISHFYDYIHNDNKANMDYREMGKLFIRPNYNFKDLYDNLKYKFPVDKIPLNSKIVVYGAGNVGTDYYSYLFYSVDYQLIGWVDKNARKYRNIKRPVNDIVDLKEMNYDCIVIGVLSEKIANEIKTELIHEGIEEKKIFWIKPKLNSSIG